MPALVVLVVPVRRTPWWPQLWKNAALFAGALAVALAASFAMYSRLAPMVRNHMHLRYIVNPIAGFTSAATVTLGPLFRKSRQLVPISAGVALGASHAAGARAAIPGRRRRRDGARRSLLAQRLSAPDQPRARNAGVLSFRDVRSCGTDTRDSLPCMLSPLGKGAFEKRSAEHENLLDLLQAAGLAVLWLDNQSGCKDVCNRVPKESTSDLPAAVAARLCSDGECLDDALLVGLDERIARLPEERRRNGVVLVMHQMGSHGPAYYKRSAPAQKRFLPECTNTTLGQCDREQLLNAYDNTIVATDRFLAETIAWLKGRGAGYAPALVYMSDHGESLGELGIFLHGLPYAFAPEAQKRVPFIAWLGAELAAQRGIDTRVPRPIARRSAQPRQSLSQRPRPGRRDDADVSARARRVRALSKGAGVVTASGRDGAATRGDRGGAARDRAGLALVALRDDVDRASGREQLAVGAGELHSRRRDARAEAEDLAAQREAFADGGTQVVDAQVDRAELAEAAQPLERRLVHVACADRRHHREPGHGVERGADDAAVQPLVQVVADQLRPHLEVAADAGGREGVDAQADEMVERNALFEERVRPATNSSSNADDGGALRVTARASATAVWCTSRRKARGRSCDHGRTSTSGCRTATWSPARTWRANTLPPCGARI